MTFSKHAALKHYLVQLYSLFVTMRYIEPSQINQPPHADFPREMWITSGIDPSAVDLLQQLPYLADACDGGPFIIPEAPCFTYGGKGASWSAPNEGPREPTYGFGAKLDPMVVALTDGGDNARWILYDTRDETIIEWPLSKDDYRNLPKQPVEEFFEDAISKFMNLEWLPEPQGWMLGEWDDVEWSRHKNDVDQDEKVWRRIGVNENRAIRKLYRDHGWPEAFNGDAFVRAFREYDELKSTMDNEAHDRYRARVAANGATSYKRFETEDRMARDQYLMDFLGDQAAI